MNKTILAGSALALLSLSAESAFASEKIMLRLGGYSKWWVTGTWQDQSFLAATNSDYNSVDVKGDNEVYFLGSTTLDNGVKVGVDIQLEAGGHTDGTTDPIDESYVYVEGGLGKVLIGSKNNGAYVLHVNAPEVTGNWNEWGLLTAGNTVVRPSAVKTISPGAPGSTTTINSDDDAEKLTYFSPSMAGLVLSASYVPQAVGVEDNRGATPMSSASIGEMSVLGGLYQNTFGGVGVKVSGGYAAYDLNGSGGGGKNGVQEYTMGGQLSYQGFTVGGAFRQVSPDAGGAQNDGNAYDFGVSYAQAPFAVSAVYFKSRVEGSTGNANKDEIEVYQLSGKYAYAPGVDILAIAGRAKFDDETDLAANNNKGWSVMTGLALSF